jgi:uroporphyrinogen III methyltransferase / synthase
MDCVVLAGVGGGEPGLLALGVHEAIREAELIVCVGGAAPMDLAWRAGARIVEATAATSAGEIARLLSSAPGGRAVYVEPGELPATGRAAGIARALIERGVDFHVLPGLVVPSSSLAAAIADAGGRRAWLARAPLAGRRIVITRAAGQGGTLSALLAGAGAEVVELPAIAIEPASDPAPLDAAIARLDTYDWLIFTSVNGVRFFFERLDASSRDLRSLRARLCTIGPATRQALEHAHLKVDRMPAEYVGESLLESFAADNLEGMRILLPRAKVARDVVPEALRSRGAHVDVVEAYRTVAPGDAAERFRAAFPGGDGEVGPRPDWITFTSSSTVKNLLRLAGGPALLDNVRIASIGPVTTATAVEAGLRVATEAAEHTMEGLVRGIVACDSRENTG